MLFVAAVVVAVGAMIFWSNPGRTVNRVAFTCSLHIATWLSLRYLAITSKELGLFWLKWTFVVSAAAPFHFWIVKESIAADSSREAQQWFRRSWAWIVFSLLMAGIVFTEYFIPSHSTETKKIFGWGYYGFIFGIMGAYGYLLRDAYKDTKRLTGGRRLELQVWLGGGWAMATIILILTALNAITNDPRYLRPQPLVVLVFYAGTLVAITMHRIFDARQILRLVLEKSTLILIMTGSVYILFQAFRAVIPSPIHFFVTTAVALWLAVVVSDRLDQLFRFYPQATLARKMAFEAAQRETRVDKLRASFRLILQGWGHSDHAIILSGSRSVNDDEGLGLTDDSPVLDTLRQMRWATPERLVRERSTQGRIALAEFIAEQRLGVLGIAEGPALTVLVGVGMGASRRPFTYPQVTQLMELASIMEGALERAHFSAKAQHTEQLATVGLLGASLAHEIRNPLVTIKTFVQLLPKHHQDAAFREKFFRLIGDEVGRIDQLTDQLLDLASPRTYEAKMVDLHPVLRASLELVAAKAAHRSIQLLTELQAAPDRIFTDVAAAKQVMLNLCFNAIQAVESLDSGERWVKVSTHNTGGGVEMAVSDSGRGIAPEIQSRLFEPFQTTRTSGFGLGLAICSDILANLNASITADPPIPGKGATFRVIFPCQPLSS